MRKLAFAQAVLTTDPLAGAFNVAAPESNAARADSACRYEAAMGDLISYVSWAGAPKLYAAELHTLGRPKCFGHVQLGW